MVTLSWFKTKLCCPEEFRTDMLIVDGYHARKHHLQESDSSSRLRGLAGNHHARLEGKAVTKMQLKCICKSLMLTIFVLLPAGASTQGHPG